MLLSLLALDTLDLGPTQLLCPDDSILHGPSANYVAYLWSNGSIGPSLSVTQTGWHWLEVMDACNVLQRDSVWIAPDNVSPPYLGPDTVLCGGQTLLLQAGTGFVNTLWQNGSTASSFTVTGAGIYCLSATSPAGCVYGDTIVVGLCIGNLNAVEKPSLTIFPNPNRGQCQLLTHFPGAVGSVTWQLFDALGIQVQSGECSPMPGDLHSAMLQTGGVVV